MTSGADAAPMVRLHQHVRGAAVLAVLALLAMLLAGCGPSTPVPTAFAPSFPTGTPPGPGATATTGPTATGPAATPAITGLTGHVVFTRAGGQYGDETIFVARIDGSDERQLTELAGGCCPWALVDGSRIVYGGESPDHRGTAVVTTLDGSSATVLPLPAGTLNLGSGPISPDGSTIAREGWDDKHPADTGIYLSDIDGSDVRRLTATQFIPGDWSPDGTQILLFQGHAGAPPPPGSLYIATLNSEDLHQLTPAGTEVQCCTGYRWSPDGSRILFAGPEGGLWTIAPDGSGLTQVFKDPAGGWAITPTWSPDGSMILFGLDPSPDPFAHPQNGLYVIRADGTGLTLVIGGPDFKREPAWVSA